MFSGGSAEHQAQLLESHVDVGQLNLDIELETMVQTFMVVQCYSCKTFQVHQVSLYHVNVTRIMYGGITI